MWKVWLQDVGFIEGVYTLDDATQVLSGYDLYIAYTNRYQYRGGYNAEGKYAFIQPIGV